MWPVLRRSWIVAVAGEWDSVVAVEVFGTDAALVYRLMPKPVSLQRDDDDGCC